MNTNPKMNKIPIERKHISEYLGLFLPRMFTLQRQMKWKVVGLSACAYEVECGSTYACVCETSGCKRSKRRRHSNRRCYEVL